MPVNSFNNDAGIDSAELTRVKDNLSNLQVRNTGILTAAGQDMPVSNVTPEQLWRAKYAILLANVTDVQIVNNTIVLLDAAAKISHYNEIPFDTIITQILGIVRDDKVHGKVRRKK